MKVKLEIRAAEGGEDSRLLVGTMADMYTKFASLNNTTLAVAGNRQSGCL